MCSQFALFHLSCWASLSLVEQSSEVQQPEIRGAAVTLWYFLRLAGFYFSIKKVTFKISKSLNIDHEDQTIFQVSCTFLQKPEVEPDFLLCLWTKDNVYTNIDFCQDWFHLLRKNWAPNVRLNWGIYSRNRYSLIAFALAKPLLIEVHQ